MTLLNLWYRIVPHRCIFGRAYVSQRAKQSPEAERYGFIAPVISKHKSCKLCGTTKPVRARGRKVVVA